MFANDKIRTVRTIRLLDWRWLPSSPPLLRLMQTDLSASSRPHACSLPPCWLQAAPTPPRRQSTRIASRQNGGITCTGKLQIPNDQEEHTIELSFDAPDRHGAQGTHLVDGRGKAGNFYGCRQSGDSLSCTYDAGGQRTADHAL